MWNVMGSVLLTMRSQVLCPGFQAWCLQKGVLHGLRYALQNP